MGRLLKGDRLRWGRAASAVSEKVCWLLLLGCCYLAWCHDPSAALWPGPLHC